MNIFPPLGKGLASKLTYLCLGAVLAAGFALRTWNVNYDSGLLPHFDERGTVCIYAPAMGWPSSLEEFRDPLRSPLNPMRVWTGRYYDTYAYGHFTLYIGIAAGELLSRLAAQAGGLGLPDRTIDLMRSANTPCQGVAFAGRLLIALADTWTIFLLFLLGRRLYGAVAGLLAATFYAFTAQAIQLSHFYAMDPASTAFVVLAVYGGVLMVQGRFWRGAFYTGGGAALAFAVKATVLPVLAVPIASALIVHVTAAKSEGTAGGRRSLFTCGAAVSASFLAVLVVLLVVNPYFILDWQKYVEKLILESNTTRGISDVHYTRRFRDSIPYVHFIQQQVAWGMGWPLGLIACAGAVWAAARALLRRAGSGEVVAWIWLAPYFGLTGAYVAMFNRYMSPVLPFVLLFAAGLIAWTWRLGAEPGRRMRARVPAAVLALAAVGGGLFWSLAYVNGVYAREHTWITANRWIYDNAPAGSTILWERAEGTIPDAIPGEPGMDLSGKRVRDLRWDPYVEDTPKKLAELRRNLGEADFVILASNRYHRSVGALPRRYPMTIRYYEMLFEEELGYSLAAQFSSMPRFLGLTFPDQKADIIWTSIDHPRVSIFAKTGGYDDAGFHAQLKEALAEAIPYDLGERGRPNAPLGQLSRLASERILSLRSGAAADAPGAEEDGGESVDGCVSLPGGHALCYCGGLSPVRDSELLLGKLRRGRPESLGSPGQEQVTLLGWELGADGSVQPGDTVPLRLFWQTSGEVTLALHSFAHLYTDSPPRSWVVAHDDDPLCFEAAQRNPGAIYVNDLKLKIPLETPPTEYTLVAGLAPAEGGRLAAPDSSDGLLRLQKLSVEPIPTGFFQRRRFLLQPRPSTTAAAVTEDGLRLRGYDLREAPGPRMLRLYWEADGEILTDWTVYIHLYDPGGELIAQFDGPPLGGLLPTSQWKRGALYVDGHTLDLPPGLQPGSYMIRAGLYDRAGSERLPFLAVRGLDDERFEAGQLTVPLFLEEGVEDGQEAMKGPPGGYEREIQ